jgi:hypothetical protein
VGLGGVRLVGSRTGQGGTKDYQWFGVNGMLGGTKMRRCVEGNGWGPGLTLRRPNRIGGGEQHIDSRLLRELPSSFLH